MTKVSGPGGASEFQPTDDGIQTPPPSAAPDQGWLSSVASATVDAFEAQTGAGTFIDSVSGIKDIVLAGGGTGVGIAETAFEFFAEGKFHDYTLNPSAAIERVVAGANESLKKYGGEDALQITAHPDLEDVVFTAEVLSGVAGKLDQLPMAAAALAVGVLHENRALTQTLTESKVFQAVKGNAGDIVHASAALTAMCLVQMPSGVAIKATQVFKDGLDGAFSTLDQSLELIRDKPVLAREQAVGMTIPMRERLERMPVGDTCEKKFKLSGEVHEGIGAKLGAEIHAEVKKLGENRFEVTLTGKADLLVGIGASAESRGATADALAKHQVEIKIEVEGKDAASVIDSGGDLTSLFKLSNPIGAVDALSKASQIDSAQVTIKMTSCDIKFERGVDVNLGPIKQQLTTELSAKTGLAVQGKFALEIKQELPVSIAGLSAEQDRSLKDCLKAMIEPTNNKSMKAEGKIRFDGELSAEFKVEIESGDNRLEADIKIEVKDAAKVAAHLNVSEEELKDISPQVLFDKMGSLPADAIQVSLTLTGHEAYLGAKLAIPPAEYSMGNSHPTEYIRIPNPDLPNQDLSANLAEARRQIVALSEGWSDERLLALKA